MPRTAGNLILTITRGSPATFMFPALNLLASKRFFQSTNDRNAVEMREIAFGFAEQIFDVE